MAAGAATILSSIAADDGTTILPRSAPSYPTPGSNFPDWLGRSSAGSSVVTSAGSVTTAMTVRRPPHGHCAAAGGGWLARHARRAVALHSFADLWAAGLVMFGVH